jgi:putative addiction module component (TIGR02574 family)
MSVAADVLDVALALSESERAEIARRLLLSLETHDSPDEVESAWAAEIDARWNRFERGETIAADWPQALARIRK